MTYIPGAMKTEEGPKVGAYTPGQKDDLEQNLAQTSFLSQELQALLREEQAKEKESKPQSEVKGEEKSVRPEECWAYLRSERNKLLLKTDSVNSMALGLSFEERGRVYAYRQALRDLPAQKGAPWTPSTIPWPICPITF